MIWVVGKCIEFNANSHDDAREVEGCTAWLGHVDAWIATVVRCLTEWKVREILENVVC